MAKYVMSEISNSPIVKMKIPSEKKKAPKQLQKDEKKLLITSSKLTNFVILHVAILCNLDVFQQLK